MSLRKSPTRTEAFLAANRRNALRSTGPRTAQGKSAIVFNSLRHGFRSRRLFETLRHADLGLQRDFARIYAALFQATNPEPRQVPWLLRAAAYIWSVKRHRERCARLPGFGASVGCGLMPLPWRWRLVDIPGPPGECWRVTVSIWVRRARGRDGQRWWLGDATTASKPVHVGVTVYRSDGRRWERIAVSSRRRSAAAGPRVPGNRAATGVHALIEKLIGERAGSRESEGEAQ